MLLRFLKAPSRIVPIVQFSNLMVFILNNLVRASGEISGKWTSDKDSDWVSEGRESGNDESFEQETNPEIHTQDVEQSLRALNSVQEIKTSNGTINSVSG